MHLRSGRLRTASPTQSTETAFSSQLAKAESGTEVESSVNPQAGKPALQAATRGCVARVQLVNSACVVGFQTGPITLPVSSELTPRIFRPALNLSALALRVALSSTTS